MELSRKATTVCSPKRKPGVSERIEDGAANEATEKMLKSRVSRRDTEIIENLLSEVLDAAISVVNKKITATEIEENKKSYRPMQFHF